MKICIPKYCLGYDLNDRQKVFMAYMLLLERNIGPGGHAMAFNIHGTDIKKILKNYHYAKQKPQMQKLLELIDVVSYDKYNNYINFDKDKKMVGCKGRSANMLLEGFTTISDPQAILLYTYILGRATDKSIISDSTDLIFHNQDSMSIANHIRKQMTIL